MNIRLFFAVIGLIVPCSWAAQQNSRIRHAEWLIGTWENKTAKGNIYEARSKVNDTELHGKSYFLNDKDTVLLETVRLVEKEQKLYYIATVADQNNGSPVSFVSAAITGDQLIFENRQHDFPQVVRYTKINADSLVAEISGVKNGQERKQTFPMKRIKGGAQRRIVK